MLAVILYGAWDLSGPIEPQPSSAEVARAAEEARLVLGLTAKALRGAKKTAIEDVLAGEVSPALQRAPIRWPGESRAGRQESGNGV